MGLTYGFSSNMHVNGNQCVAHSLLPRDEVLPDVRQLENPCNAWDRGERKACTRGNATSMG